MGALARERRRYARASNPISYAELVRLTGIEFLPGVSPRD